MPAVPVNWLTVLGTLAALVGTAGLGGIIKAWLDHKAVARKQTDDVALGFADRFEARVGKLEAALKEERVRCDAELGVQRHEIRGLWQLIYSLLHLFDVPAAKRKELLAGVRQEIASLQQSAAAEKSMIVAATIGNADTASATDV